MTTTPAAHRYSENEFYLATRGLLGEFDETDWEGIDKPSQINIQQLKDNLSKAAIFTYPKLNVLHFLIALVGIAMIIFSVYYIYSCDFSKPLDGFHITISSLCFIAGAICLSALIHHMRKKILNSEIRTLQKDIDALPKIQEKISENKEQIISKLEETSKREYSCHVFGLVCIMIGSFAVYCLGFHEPHKITITHDQKIHDNFVHFFPSHWQIRLSVALAFYMIGGLIFLGFNTSNASNIKKIDALKRNDISEYTEQEYAEKKSLFSCA